MFLNKRTATAVLFSLLCLIPACPLQGQAVAVASITGTVADLQGAVIPNAHVAAIATDTGIRHEVSTNGDGIYSFSGIPIGAYSLSVEAPGFQTFMTKGILLQVGDHLQQNATLAVGSQSQVVEVQASLGTVQTQENSISQVIDQKRIVEMPLNGRDPAQLVLVSGASVYAPGGGNIGSKSFFSSHAISIGGGQGNGTNYLLDGGDNNDSFTNVNMPFPFPDALQEFSVDTSSLPARNGLHPGGLVNAVTRSGSNQWHGTLFEFVRNGDVNAINYFGTRQDSLKRNQFGGTVGGKIKTDKIFFFFGFQQSNIRQDPNSSQLYVPTQAALNGDFSTLDGSGCVTGGRNIKDPATGLTIPNKQIDPHRFNASSLALMKYLPAAENGCGTVHFGVPVSSNERQYVTREDWNISPRHLLYGRYFTDQYDLKAFFDPHNILVTNVSGNNERTQSMVLGDTFTFTPTIVNSFHATAERRRNDRGPASNGINATTLGIQSYQPVPNFLWVTMTNGGFNAGCGTCAPAHFNTNTFQFADDVDILRGKHQIAFGVDILRTQNNTTNQYYAPGSFYFNGQFSNDVLLDFLMGDMNDFKQSGAQQVALRQTIAGFYVQDTYHLNKHFVVNAGLRFEPMLLPQDYFHRGSVFSRAAFDAGQTSQIYINAPAGSLYYGDKGVSKSFGHNKLANFSPRLGVVFDPTGEGKTTFRAGTALLYDSASTYLTYPVNATNPPYGAIIDNSNNPNFSTPWASAPGGNPFPQPFPLSSTVPFALAATHFTFPNAIRPMTMVQYNLSMQHQFNQWVMSISYLGNRSKHIWMGQELNPGVYIPGNCGAAPCSTTANTQSRRVLTRANAAQGAYYSQIVQVYDGTDASYNGLLASLDRRFAKGFTFLSNYTWSKCLSDADQSGNLNPEGNFQNPYNAKGDRGPCNFDATNIFNLSVVWRSQWSGRRITSALLSGWQVAPLVRYQTGLPVNPTTGTDNSRTGIGNDRPNYASPGAYIKAPHSSKGFLYFDKTHYVANTIGTFGNAQHNGLRGPSYMDVDASLSKDFPLHERLALNVRVDAFNVLNHPNFNSPSGSIASAQFGLVNSANDPRIWQGSMKFTF